MTSESPLNKKCQRIIDKRLAPAYRELAKMLLLMDGIDVPASDIIPVFAAPETVQPMTQAQIFNTLAEKGTLEGAAEIAGFNLLLSIGERIQTSGNVLGIPRERDIPLFLLM